MLAFGVRFFLVLIAREGYREKCCSLLLFALLEQPNPTYRVAISAFFGKQKSAHKKSLHPLTFSHRPATQGLPGIDDLTKQVCRFFSIVNRRVGLAVIEIDVSHLAGFGQYRLAVG